MADGLVVRMGGKVFVQYHGRLHEYHDPTIVDFVRKAIWSGDSTPLSYYDINGKLHELDLSVFERVADVVRTNDAPFGINVDAPVDIVVGAAHKANNFLGWWLDTARMSVDVREVIENAASVVEAVIAWM